MTAFKGYLERKGQSVYYGLRYGFCFAKQNYKVGGKRQNPPFATALEMATEIELQKAIAFFEQRPHYSQAALRVERMKQRLEELTKGERP